MSKQFLTISEAAQHFGKSERTIYQWAADGRIERVTTADGVRIVVDTENQFAKLNGALNQLKEKRAANKEPSEPLDGAGVDYIEKVLTIYGTPQEYIYELIALRDVSIDDNDLEALLDDETDTQVAANALGITPRELLQVFGLDEFGYAHNLYLDTGVKTPFRTISLRRVLDFAIEFCGGNHG